MTTKTRVSLEEFLKLPETKPHLELIDGEIVEKPMPTYNHGLLQLEIGSELKTYLRRTRLGQVVAEVRHADLPDEWVFLPDVSVTLKDRLPDPSSRAAGPIEVMPDFAIEVLSPEDRPGRLAQRIAFYMRAGVRLLWVVDPEQRTITAWEAGAPPRISPSEGPFSADPVLPGFSIDIGELFSVLDEV